MNDKRTSKRKTGDRGEDIACRYLLKKGYEIIKRNYLTKTGEIDIIASSADNNMLVFVEVKTRNSVSYGYPCEFVNRKKQRLIKNTAECFLLCYPMYRSFLISFDIIEVLLLKKGRYIRHLRNAY